MRDRFSYLILFFFLGFYQYTPGQELHFHHYNIKDGLVHSGTGSREVIIQDKEGFLWFSTHHGISRFDGIEFKNFRYDPRNPRSIGNNWTVGIVEADDGKIWVGTADEGLYIFDPVTEAFESIGEAEGACGYGLNTLNKDQDGNIWIGTRFNGFCRWVKETGNFEQVGNLRNGHHFFQQKDGTVWLGEQRGLFKVLPDGTPQLMSMPPGVPDDWRYRVVQDQVELPDGKFLLTTSFEGFWEFDPVAEVFRDLTQAFQFKNTKAPYSFLDDENGKIWIGADGELWLWNPLNNTKTVYLHDDKNPYKVPSTMIPCMAKDQAGSLWLITGSDGLAVAHDLNNPFEIIGKMPLIQLLPLDEKQVIVWSYDGVFSYEYQTKKMMPGGLPVGPLQGINPKLIRVSNEEILISEGDRGTAKLYNTQTGAVELLPEKGPGNNFHQAGGRIWENLRYLDLLTNQWIDAFPEMQRNIPGFISSMTFFQDITHDVGERIWISTTGGLFNYDLETKQGKVYRHDPNDPHSLPSLVCQLMYKGKGRKLYVATTNGLAVYDQENDRFNIYNQQNGLLHDMVNTVVEDAHGNPWIGTALGLQKLDIKTNNFTNYDVNDGLPGEFIEDRGFCGEGGWLYFVTADKAFRFHPDSLPSRDYSAPVYLIDFFQNHQPVAIGASDGILHKMLRYTPSLTLPFNKNDFGFSFVMPVFYKPEKTNYFYRLLPYQAEWQSAGNDRHTHYTNIDPGNYTFQVKAKTANGSWCSEEASVVIVILPPWYQSWWARVLYVLMLGGLAYFSYRFQLNRKLEHAEAERIKELDTLKTRLYSNITHEFRTPLTVIMGMTDNISGHKNERKIIQRNSKNLLRLINQLLDLSKLDSGALKMEVVQRDIINYLQYLTESFHSMAHEKKVRLTFYSEIPKLVMDFDEVKIQHVIYNLVSNALKFTGEGGKVVLHANQTENNGQPFLKLKIQDTGIGIPEDQLAHIFDRFYQADNSSTRKGEGTGIGLALTKELAGLMGGSISVESTAGKGTTFTLLLPVRLEAVTSLTPSAYQSARTLVPELAPDWPATNASPHTSDEKVGLRGEKPLLLVIEDNADVVTYIVGLLEREYDIHTASDGRMGIEKAYELVPDIIISDVMMPEKDGYEVCETLKMDERTSHIPIILLTAKAEASDRITGLRKGADAYLMKPFNKEELYVRLEKLLELRRVLQLRYGAISKGVVLSHPLTSEAEPTLEDLFLHKLQNVVFENLDNPSLSAEQLCRVVLLSPSQLYRKMTALTGEPPNAFIRKIRLHRAMELLVTTDKNISEIAYSTGFNDPNYFSRSFTREFGKPPSAYRN